MIFIADFYKEKALVSLHRVIVLEEASCLKNTQGMPPHRVSYSPF